MIENVLTGIEGVGLYGVVSICIFFAVFVIAAAWVMTLKKDQLRSLSELPLNDGATEKNPSQPKH